MNNNETKSEIDRLVVELKIRIAEYERRENSQTRLDSETTPNHEERENWVACSEAVKRAGGWIEGYELDPSNYASVLKKLNTAANR